MGNLEHDHNLSSTLFQLKTYFSVLESDAREEGGDAGKVVLTQENCNDLARLLFSLHEAVLALECRYLSGERAGSETA